VIAPEDPDLPIKFGPCASDEYAPRPLSGFVREVVRRAREACDDNARYTGMSRRDFLRTACAAATTLLVLDACSKQAHRAAGSRPGGTFSLPRESTTEAAAAEHALGGEEFIFDVQGHLLDHSLDRQALDEIDLIASGFPQRNCGEHEPRDCFSIEHFLEEMFLRSDTNMLVLSAVPLPLEHDPLAPEVMEVTRRLVGTLCHDDRVLLHGKVAPTARPLAEVLAGMERLAASHPIVGWKTYTHLVGPGWWLDDHEPGAPAVGEAFIRKAVELGIPRIAVHKGLVGAAYNTPEDIGPAARAHPDVQFLVYHGAYEIGLREGPFTGSGATRGANRLVASMRRAGIGPNQNVLVDLGTTWWHAMRDPNDAAHLLGKLLRFVGQDNVVWGTDSIWYGSPQDQIQAFRAFEITPEFQERYGYPALTKQLKAKVLGLNGARVYSVRTPVTSRCTFSRSDLVEMRRHLPGGSALHGPTTLAEARALARLHSPLV
jgi:predicted TIM-barrel fold metal-dependent hydrolase